MKLLKICFVLVSCISANRILEQGQSSDMTADQIKESVTTCEIEVNHQKDTLIKDKYKIDIECITDQENTMSTTHNVRSTTAYCNEEDQEFQLNVLIKEEQIRPQNIEVIKTEDFEEKDKKINANITPTSEAQNVENKDEKKVEETPNPDQSQVQETQNNEVKNRKLRRVRNLRLEGYLKKHYFGGRILSNDEVQKVEDEVQNQTQNAQEVSDQTLQKTDEVSDQLQQKTEDASDQLQQKAQSVEDDAENKLQDGENKLDQGLDGTPEQKDKLVYDNEHVDQNSPQTDNNLTESIQQKASDVKENVAEKVEDVTDDLKDKKDQVVDSENQQKQDQTTEKKQEDTDKKPEEQAKVDTKATSLSLGSVPMKPGVRYTVKIKGLVATNIKASDTDASSCNVILEQKYTGILMMVAQVFMVLLFQQIIQNRLKFRKYFIHFINSVYIQFKTCSMLAFESFQNLKQAAIAISKGNPKFIIYSYKDNLFA